MRINAGAVLVLFLGLCLFGASQVEAARTQQPLNARQERVQEAHANWKQQSGRRLNALLINEDSIPSLVIASLARRQPEEMADEYFAMVDALQTLLAADVHDRVRLVVTSHNPRRLSERTVKERVITRQEFRAIVARVTGRPFSREAIGVLRIDHENLLLLCDQLGIK